MRSLSKVVFAVALGLASIWFSSSRAQEAVDWSRAVSIEIVMTDYAFAPETLRLKAGTPYKLHFVNKTSKGHSFESQDFFTDALIGPGDQSKIQDGEIDLDGGQTATLAVLPRKAGSYDVRCTHPLHALFGMTGKIVVE